MDTGYGTHLTGSDCHAVVVGTGSHPTGSRLADLPGAVRSAAALAETLRTACGMPGDQIRLLTDPGGPTEVLAAVEEAVDRAEGSVVVFCFVGHGLLGPADQLYLATGATSARSTVHAVPYTEIRDLLGAAPVRPVVILDCCFSGLAEAAHQGSRPDPYVSARPDGSYLLTSATHYASSFAPEGAEHTLFSGELLRLLREGDAGGPKWFTLADVYRHLDRRLQGGRARPHADTVGRMGDLVLAANPRYAPTTGHDPRPADTRPERDESPCPYPGMRPFLPEQRHLFFGREELTAALLDRVTRTEPAGPVMLVGPSGVGKSSLLRAGLGAALGTSEPGPVLLVPAPGARPFHTVVARWAEAVGRPFGEVEQALGAGRFIGPAGGGRSPGVLVIDQLEEIFTHCEDMEERELFVRAVSGEETPAADGTGPRIVLGLRADYFGHCLRDPRLSRVARAGQFTVPAMTEDELRSAVERPAAYAGLRLEDGLCDLLLRELQETRGGAGDAIALPFLAHALQETWAGRTGTRLTFGGYQETGGIGTSVARAADRVHDALDAAGRRDLRELCLRMVRLVDGQGKAVRRRVRIDDLDTDDPRSGVAALLALLTDARLVIVDNGEAQLCHDSLLHGWPRLRDWINADLDGLLVRRRLGEAADAWDETGRPPSGLYAGEHLAAARSLTDDDDRALPTRPVERAFLGASDRAERRRRRLLMAGGAIVVALALLASVLAVVARRSQQETAKRETLLIADQLATQADIMRGRDPRTALGLSLAAYRTAQTPESRSSLYASYLSLAPADLKGSVSEPVLTVAFSSDSEILGTSHRGGRVQLWDIARPEAPRRAAALDLDDTAVIAFHPRSRLLAVLSNHRLAVWNVADARRPKRIAEYRTAEEIPYTLAFSPDGKALASSGEKGRLRLWDLTEPARPEPRAERAVSSVALASLSFSSDGRLLVTGNGRSGPKGATPAQVRLWDVSDPARPAVLSTGTAESVVAVAFHPRRGLVAATGSEGELAWWSVDDNRRLRSLAAEIPDHDWEIGDALPSLSFRPDGGVLAAADSSGEVQLRTLGATTASFNDLGSEARLSAAEPVQAVAYNPDGTLLASGDVRGSVRLWPKRPPAPSVEGPLAYPAPGTEAISDDGRLLLTTRLGRSDEQFRKTSQVWDVTDASAPRRALLVPEPWEARNFLPDRRRTTLLTHRWTPKTKNHAFQLWEFDDSGGKPERGADFPFTADDLTTAVSPDGALLAIRDVAGPRTELWDVSDIHAPQRRAVIDAPVINGSDAIFFMSREAMVTAEGGDLRFWDVSDPAHPRRAAHVEAGPVRTAGTYVPESRLLIVETVAEEVSLWDLRDIDRPRRAGELPAATGLYFPVGENSLMTVLTDGTAEFWDMTHPEGPERTHTLRFDRPIQSVTTSPDHRWAVTAQPSRIWSVGPDGRWQTPSLATLTGAAQIAFFPHDRPLMAFTPNTSLRDTIGDRTYLLDLDTDRVYRELCRRYPASVGRAQWESLFPHIGHRRSCA
ncbi:caspase, EACC1-associated type [Streptomyces sp. SID1121]|uniref:caspase, EACC1-associated type n=1 Tax=Streptomyces sp. SID1121 TaxID=3425888 RepID=UPI0040578F67